MTMNKRSAIIVLAIALTLSAESLAAEQCSKKSKEYATAGDEFLGEMHKVVLSRLSQNTTEDVNVTQLSAKMNHFLETGNKHCFDGKLNTTWNSVIYMNIIKFSLNDTAVLKELAQKGVFECIKQHTLSIEKCVTDSGITNWSNSSKYRKLMRKNHLTYNDLFCSQTRSIGNCTVNILNEHCASGVDYVRSLFEYIINYENKCVFKEVHDAPSGSNKLTGFYGAFVMFSVWKAISMFNY